jgi:hypothetical protein
MAIKVTISGDGLSFEKETNLQKAGQIVAFLGREEGDIEYKPTTPIGVLPNTSITGLSIKDQISQSKAKTNAEIITVVGKYLEESNKSEEFLRKEVLLQLRKNGEVPSNFTRDLKTAIALQYIYGRGKEGVYGVTEKGKQAIINQFKDAVQTRVKVGKNGGSKTANPPRDAVTALTIVGEMSGYPNFHKLKTRADKILWILAYADQMQISELTPREVEFISDKLKFVIISKDFAAHNKRNIKETYVAVGKGTFKIQQNGLNHLKSLLSIENEHKQE